LNKEHVPYVLYDLALTIGSEVRLVPMLTRTLQRLLFHTGFPMGLVLMDSQRHDDVVQSRLVAVVGDHALTARCDTLLSLPASLVPERPTVIADADALGNLQGSRKYRHGISLPFEQTGTILLLSAAPVANTQLLTQVLQPVLRNLDRAARLCRDSERLTETLESDLARKTLLLQAVIDTVPAWVFWKSRELVYLGCNPEFARAAGRAAPEDVVGLTDYDLAWASQAAAYRADDLAVMESGKVKLSYEEPTTTGDGRITWLRTSKAPLKGPDGSVIGVLGIGEVITARRQAEADLDEARSRLQQALTAGSLGVWSADQTMAALELDERCWNFLGVPPAQRSTHLPREKLLAAVHPDDQARFGELIRHARERGTALQTVCRILQPTGAIRHLHIAAQYSLDAKGKPHRAVGVAHDVTDQVELQGSLRQANERVTAANTILEGRRDELEALVDARTHELAAALDRAQSADRAKSAFLATTSHELRTPLNAIIGFSSLLLDGSMGELGEIQRKPVEIVKRSGEQLLDLVRDILDMTLIEGGNLKIDAVRVNLGEVLREQWEGFGLRAGERNLEWRPVECDPSIFVFCDRSRLSQVIRNLMANALTFTDEGYVQVRGLVRDGRAVIEVADTGIGVPADQLDKLFQPFQPIHGQSGPLRQRTGLGLAICRRLVEAMSGTIGVDSTAGNGSRFWFTVPLG
jgi:PAS domain S-box-containing protein